MRIKTTIVVQGIRNTPWTSCAPTSKFSWKQRLYYMVSIFGLMGNVHSMNFRKPSEGTSFILKISSSEYTWQGHHRSYWDCLKMLQSSCKSFSLTSIKAFVKATTSLKTMRQKQGRGWRSTLGWSREPRKNMDAYKHWKEYPETMEALLVRFWEAGGWEERVWNKENQRFVWPKVPRVQAGAELMNEWLLG